MLNCEKTKLGESKKAMLVANTPVSNANITGLATLCNVLGILNKQ
jgi:hypothetical protein